MRIEISSMETYLGLLHIWNAEFDAKSILFQIYISNFKFSEKGFFISNEDEFYSYFYILNGESPSKLEFGTLSNFESPAVCPIEHRFSTRLA